MAVSDNVGLLLRIKSQNLTKADFNAVDKDIAKLSGSTSELGSSTSSLAGISSIAAGAIAAIGTAAVAAAVGLFSLAKSASEYGRELSSAQINTGLSIQTLSLLRAAAHLVGEELADMVTPITNFSKLIGAAAKGSDEAADKLTRLGIDPQEAIKDLDGALEKVFKRIFDLPPGVARTTAAFDAFGKGGTNLLDIIVKTGGSFEAFKKKAQELGLVMSDEDVKASKEFGAALKTLEAQSKAVAFQFAKEFLPVFTDGMKDLSKWFAQNKAEVKAWGKEAGDVLLGLKTIAQDLYEFSQTDAGRFLRAFLMPVPSLIYKGIVAYGGGALPKPATRDQIEGKTTVINPNAAQDYLDDLEAQKKAAEERKKREQEEIAARQKFLAANKESIQQAFDELQAITQKNYEDQLITAEKFHQDFEENERQFRVRMIELVEESFKIQLSQAKNDTDRRAIEIEQRNVIEKIISESDKRITDSQKLVTDTQKKNSEERIKNAEDEVSRKIKAAEAFVEKQIALINAEDIAESEKVAKHGIQEAALLAAKKSAYEKLLVFVKGNAEKEIEIQTEIDKLDAEITNRRVANAKERADAVENERKAFEDLHDALKRIKDEIDASAGEDEEQGKEGSGAPGILGDFIDQMNQVFGMGDKLPTLANMFTDFAGIVAGAFQGVAQAIGSVISQFVLYGKTGPAIMRQILASALATIAAEAAVRAIYHLAMGFAMLFFNPGAATQQFVAAALFGSIAVGAALAGRAVAGNAFRQQASAATGQTGANTQGSRAPGGAYSGREDMTYEQSRNSPSGIGRTIVVRDKTSGGMFDQLFEFAWDGNGRMRSRLQTEFGK